MARDRSKPWGPQADEDPDPTHPNASSDWDDAETQGTSGRRRAPRKGSRRNDDETNVGGSLLPGDDFGLAAVFEQALAPAYVSEGSDEVERTEPVASVPSPPAKARRPAPPRPPEPPKQEYARPRAAPSLGDEDGLGPVEEFTISGLMPDELKALSDAARKAVEMADEEPSLPSAPVPTAGARPAARTVEADPPRSRRDDPDPLITGVLAPPGGPPPGAVPRPNPLDEEDLDEQETLSMNLHEHPELMRELRPSSDAGRDYHTFGAGLQRLDQLPDLPERKGEPSGGGILELLDGSPPPASPTGPNPAPGADDSSESDDRPRRISTNRAGSMGKGRAPTPSPAKQRSVAPSRGATPRPAPSRSELPSREALRRSDGRTRSSTSPPSKPPTPAPRPTTTGRAMDEEARIRAALASVSEDEHTSWVKLDEPEPATPAPRSPGNRPRAQRPKGAMPGVTPVGGGKRITAPEPGLTQDLTQVTPGQAPLRTQGEATKPLDHDDEDIGDEATVIHGGRSSLGEEVTIPAGGPPSTPPSDDATVPVKVPNTRLKADEPTVPTPAASAPPAPGARPPVKPPAAKPPPAKPPPAKKPGDVSAKSPSSGSTKAKPPVAISPLGEESPDSYRDGALPWIASIFAVMLIGGGVIAFLFLLLFLV